MAIEKITKFSDAIQPADIINEVVDVVNNADLEEFVGASESQAGKKGIVPAPEAGSEDRYLNADGTWKEVKQNLTIYTSLEQIGITPGEETFESIHNALSLNSELVYYRSTSLTFNNEMYPEGSNYGYVKVLKLNSGLTKFEYVQYSTTSNDEGSIETNDQLNIGIIYETYFNATYPLRPVNWNRHLSNKPKDRQEIIGALSLNSPTSISREKLSIISSDIDGSDKNIDNYSDIVFKRDDSYRLGLIRSRIQKSQSQEGIDELRNTLDIGVTQSEAQGGGFKPFISGNYSPGDQKLYLSMGEYVKINGDLNISGSLIGTPKATTPGTADNSTRIATTAFTQALLKENIKYSTTDLTAGSSTLKTGAIYLVYE